MKNLKLIRGQRSEKETLGDLYVMDDELTGMDNQIIQVDPAIILFQCKTLELPWKNNQHKISCIPVGVYDVVKFNSPHNGHVFLLENVPDRGDIEIHAGNYYTDILGCILVGKSYSDLNDDGVIDVLSSRVTLLHLLDLMPDKFKITIQ
jgi:hypothetical protein